MTETELLIEYAKCWNHHDVAYIEPYLDENLQYTSQWVFDTMYGKETYLNYLSSKFATIKSKHGFIDITADVGYFEGYCFGTENKPCIVMIQRLNGEEIKNSLLIKTKNDKITEIDLCGIPNPDDAILFGIFPK